jgi:hypothetical protein
VDRRRKEPDRLVKRTATRRSRWIYLIVANGDIHKEIPQAQAAAREGGDVVAWPKPGRPLVVVGGPRFDVTAAEALGVDRVLGKGTTPGEVASYPAHMLRTGSDR